ncbi:hypothetical protein B0H14DRAFT_2746863 [Mycena olivaceomarginata]|nr:hypothetical protein B0H14DRAFT_2746863 [Mycena olivaceomarginata]
MQVGDCVRKHSHSWADFARTSTSPQKVSTSDTSFLRVGQIPWITHGKMARQRAKAVNSSSRFQVLVQPQNPPILYFKLLGVLLVFLYLLLLHMTDHPPFLSPPLVLSRLSSMPRSLAGRGPPISPPSTGSVSPSSPRISLEDLARRVVSMESARRMY